ncbi:MAG: protein meaA [Deltaproteobacteria bacterium]|nr:protein meaA [Deltaproteobacteria bacterium]
MPDRPWIIRTYAGHSTAEASNRLYRENLAKGQTGLSIAFDLPTQTGYDADDPLALGEVGKVGVPIGSITDMDALLEAIPLDQMNTSMTINATACWMLALYIAVAERRGVSRASLKGTTQNDIIKEYLSRGTYIFPPAGSLKLVTDMIEFTVDEVPNWNPVNISSYHLQEVGATPVQEIAFALANAIAILDGVNVPEERFPAVFGRISFFCNAGIRFVEELCKLRAFTGLWDRLGRERYGVDDPKMRRFRYGVQVNSLGLTEAQPENNIARIIIEALGVTLSKDARCRSLQLPAWNEAMGLPRPWDQQLSLRMQQILAYETDLLEYADIFDGSPVIERKVAEISDAAWQEVERILEQGGAVEAVESGYMKRRLVESNARRIAAIESGEQIVVGVNRFQETEESPLTEGGGSRVLTVDDSAERTQLERLRAHRASRNAAEVDAALHGLRDALSNGANAMPPSIRCAEAGVTTGEWAATAREVLGEYRAPTGIEAPLRLAGHDSDFESVRRRIAEVSDRLGRRLKLLVGKPGLDGHSSGAEQIAIFARDAGFEVVYEGIRLTPDEIVLSAQQEGVHLIGLSILSGSHLTLVPQILERVNVPVVVGGIIPEEDAADLRAKGVAAVYTPRDYDVQRIVREMVEVAARAHGVG